MPTMKCGWESNKGQDTELKFSNAFSPANLERLKDLLIRM